MKWTLAAATVTTLITLINNCANCLGVAVVNFPSVAFVNVNRLVDAWKGGDLRREKWRQ